MGWRYLSFTLGGFTLVLASIRFFVFELLESPRFLAGDGRNSDAVKVIHELAKFNGKTSSLTVEELEAPDRASAFSFSKEKHGILSKSSKINTRHIKALFNTPKMAWSTSLLIFIWGKEIVIVVRAMIHCTQVFLDLPLRCIVISFHICGLSD